MVTVASSRGVEAGAALQLVGTNLATGGVTDAAKTEALKEAVPAEFPADMQQRVSARGAAITLEGSIVEGEASAASAALVERQEGGGGEAPWRAEANRVCLKLGCER